MNISTYESRIKALEDQLNPPAPSGSTGLLSVVVSPDINLNDGTTLNAKLAALMPVEPDEAPHIVETNAVVVEDTEYTVTATPGSGWYGVAFGPEGQAIGDTAGTPVSLSLTPTVSGGDIQLAVTAGASATGTEEGQASIVSLQLSRRRQEQPRN